MHIVYFDSLCNVCNRFIDFLIRHDHGGRLHFAPLQGTTAAQNLPSDLVAEMSTMAYQKDSKITVKSTAALQSIAELGGIFTLARILLLIPQFLRDAVYQWVANHRHLIKGLDLTALDRTRFLN